MITPELVDYVKNRRSAGVTEEEIRQTLKTNGNWSDTDIQEALQAAVAADPAMPTPMPPSAPFPTSPAPSSFSRPTYSAMPALAPRMQTSAGPASSRAPRGSKSSLIVIIIAALLIIGGITFAFASGMATKLLSRLTSKPPYAEGQLFAGIATKASTINTMHYKVAASIDTDPRDAGTVPFQAPAIDPSVTAAYGRDVTRADDIRNLLATLRSRSQYPQRLTDLQGAYGYYGMHVQMNDPSGHPYLYRNTGTGFTLAVTFETDQAVNQVKTQLDSAHSSYAHFAAIPPMPYVSSAYYAGYKNEPVISGRTFTFDPSSDSYSLYLSSDVPKPAMVTLTDSLKSAPGTMTFDASLSGLYQKPGVGSSLNGDAVFDASGTFDDLSIAANVEVKKIASDYYVILNKFPSILFFSAYAPIKGKWIKITGATSTSPYSSMLNSFIDARVSVIKESESEQARVKADLKTIIDIADQTRVLTFAGAPVKEEVNGVPAYRYTLVLNRDNLLAFFEAIAVEAAKPGHSVELATIDAQRMIDYLKSSDASPTMDFLEKNMFFTIWTDPQGTPLQGKFRFRIVPPDTAVQLAQKQIDLVFTLTFSNINEPVDVRAPDTYMTSDQALTLLSQNSPYGNAVLRGKDARIMSDVQQMRTDVEVNYANGGYKKALYANNGKAVQGAGIINSGNRATILTDVSSNGSIIYAITNIGPTSYAIYGRLVSDQTKYFCVDSTGGTNSSTSNNTSATCR